MNGEKYTMLTLIQKKVGVAVISSDSAEFRQSEVIRDTKVHYIIRKGSILREDNNPSCVCTKTQNVQIHEAKTYKTARRNR